MYIPQEFILPYIISNIAAILILISAIYWPRIARLLFFLLFGWASIINATTAINNPEVYLEYANYTFLYTYETFINNFFAQNATILVLMIAFGQLGISIGMLLKGKLLKTAAIGAIIFLLAIAPLGVAAAFPFSLIVSVAAFLVFRYKGQEFLWKWKINAGKHKKMRYV